MVSDRFVLGNFQINYDDLVFGELIGNGAFAAVFKGKFQGQTVAIKKLNTRVEEKVRLEFEGEARLLTQMTHPNIVQLIGISFHHPNLCLITEYCKFGSLFLIIHNKRIILDPYHIKNFCLDVVKGMTYLHSRNIIHRDLKTPNLLVHENWSVKVADFGLSRERDRMDFIQTMTACGTPAWAAPEVLSFQKYSLKADVYSFGVCLWEMCCREIPFDKMPPAKIIIGVATEGMKLPLPSSFPNEFKEVFAQCTSSDPPSRPEFTELLEQIEAIDFPISKHPHPYKERNKNDGKN